MRPLLPAPPSGTSDRKIALYYGLAFGAILTLVSFILALFPAANSLSLLILLLGYLWTGVLAGRSAGRLWPGSLAGFIVALVSAGILVLESLALLFIFNRGVLDTYIVQQAHKQHKAPDQIASSVTNVILSTTISAFFVKLLLGALFGALGGMFGQRQYKFAPIQEDQSEEELQSEIKTENSDKNL